MPYIKNDKSGVFCMAKEAHHKLGEVSRDDWDLAIVFVENEKELIGQWVYGYGFIDVRFPKTSVRELTKEEIEKYDQTLVGVSGVPHGKLEMKTQYLWKKGD